MSRWLQHTATHLAATHCNTLQHTWCGACGIRVGCNASVATGARPTLPVRVNLCCKVKVPTFALGLSHWATEQILRWLYMFVKTMTKGREYLFVNQNWMGGLIRNRRLKWGEGGSTKRQRFAVRARFSGTRRWGGTCFRNRESKKFQVIFC